MKAATRLLVAAVCVATLPPAVATAKAQLPPRPDNLAESAPIMPPSPDESRPAFPTVPPPAEEPAPEPSAIATVPPLPPRKPVYNSCLVDGPQLAITFDDGPHPTHTPRLLDMLKERGIKATFYVLGQRVVEHPEIVRRMVDEGHEIGNHTWNHPALTKISASRIASEINRTTEAIENAVGVRPTTFRPPYGATNQSINKRLNDEFGLTVAMWSVDPQDWKYRNAPRVSNHIATHGKPGAIILAHDIHASTIDAMPAALDALIGQGYKFATVSELIELEGFKLAKNNAEPAPPTPSDAPAAGDTPQN
jgi:peptidoglycan-N-acetylglucosamine deacetylase